MSRSPTLPVRGVNNPRFTLPSVEIRWSPVSTRVTLFESRPSVVKRILSRRAGAIRPLGTASNDFVGKMRALDNVGRTDRNQLKPRRDA